MNFEVFFIKKKNIQFLKKKSTKPEFFLFKKNLKPYILAALVLVSGIINLYLSVLVSGIINLYVSVLSPEKATFPSAYSQYSNRS